MNAAVANAVFNATGRRVRTLPIRLESLLPGAELEHVGTGVNRWGIPMEREI
jgi:hypothetical protein